MLLSIKCAAVTSVQVHLEFDDNQTKDYIIAKGDLVDCTYNANGLVKHVVGKVVSISAIGADPAGWYIVVDGSDDFSGKYARFSPMSILDIEVLRKGDMEQEVRTVLGSTAVPYLREVDGHLQYSKDGVNWKPIKWHRDRDIIEDQEGTVPEMPHPCRPPKPPVDEDDVIEDAVW